jgi:hypothetical protein
VTLPLLDAPLAPLGVGNPDDLLAEGVLPGVELPDAPLALPVPPRAGAGTRNEPNTVAAPPGAALPHGDAATAIDNALAAVGTPYVWGGTDPKTGLDCSGLLFYAFNSAGIDMPRYRAVDYGHMGMAVDVQDARAGDIVYFDEPGDTDHVGLYLGNGQFIEAPKPGEKVQVSPLRGGAQIRRVLPDTAVHGLPADAEGNTVYHGNNTVFTGGKAPADHPGAQRDPYEQLNALDVGQSLSELTGQQPNLSDIFGSSIDPLATGASSGGAPEPVLGGGGSFDRFFGAVAGQESGGDYSVVNSGSGAVGKYQIMPDNIPEWTRQALGHSLTPEQFRASPQAQEATARWKLQDYVNRYGMRGAAAAWYSGNPGRANDYTPLRNGSGPAVGTYVDQVLGRM